MLETDRLILRPMTLDDANFMYELNRDSEVVKFTGDGICKSVDEARAIILERVLPQQQKYKMGRFSTFLKDGTYVGWCGLKWRDEGMVDLGYRFKREFWGKGYATESSRASLAYGFETLMLDRIVACAMTENLASIAVMKKLGMTYRGFFDNPDDPHPHVLYDMTKTEWTKCKE